jgi:hypothetical protein
VAAIYHTVFGWLAPYAYTSLPVFLGTTGGAGLLVGASGLLIERHRRDPSLGDPAQDSSDVSFIALLLLVALTGLAAVLREQAIVSALLITFRCGAGAFSHPAVWQLFTAFIEQWRSSGARGKPAAQGSYFRPPSPASSRCPKRNTHSHRRHNGRGSIRERL